MKHFGVVIAALSVLELVGVLIIAFLGPLKVEHTEAIDLAPGSTSIGHLAVDMMGGGVISGEFVSDSGRQVLFVMLDEEQYDDLVAGRQYDTHFSEIGYSVNFSVDRPAMEWCHIVVQHAVEPDSPERVTVSLTVSSMDWDITFAATGLAGGSAILMGIVMIKHQRDKKVERGPMSPYIDVVIFDEEPRK
ncbi:MAG TPA: hypothetical protein VGB78_04995 [Thermoplasmata archaeon]|jgi:hypothetical protein